MLLFFMDISLTAVLVFAFLVVMAFLLGRFWCRYLCPYGALLGLLGWFGPSRVTRSDALCTGCHACDRACPENLKISAAAAVVTPECTGCLDCVEACPVQGALQYKFLGMGGRKKYGLPLAMLAVFALIIVTAMVAGYWESPIRPEALMELYQYMDM